MIHELEAAATILSGPPDANPISLGNQFQTGAVGRPSIQILPTDLAVLSSGRVSRRRLAELYHCHPRTIRRRLLEFNLLSPGPPVYMDEEQADGSIS